MPPKQPECDGDSMDECDELRSKRGTKRRGVTPARTERPTEFRKRVTRSTTRCDEMNDDVNLEEEPRNSLQMDMIKEIHDEKMIINHSKYPFHMIPFAFMHPVQSLMQIMLLQHLKRIPLYKTISEYRNGRDDIYNMNFQTTLTQPLESPININNFEVVSNLHERDMHTILGFNSTGVHGIDYALVSLTYNSYGTRLNQLVIICLNSIEAILKGIPIPNKKTRSLTNADMAEAQKQQQAEAGAQQANVNAEIEGSSFKGKMGKILDILSSLKENLDKDNDTFTENFNEFTNNINEFIKTFQPRNKSKLKLINDIEIQKNAIFVFQSMKVQELANTGHCHKIMFIKGPLQSKHLVKLGISTPHNLNIPLTDMIESNTTFAVHHFKEGIIPSDNAFLHILFLQEKNNQAVLFELIRSHNVMKFGNKVNDNVGIYSLLESSEFNQNMFENICMNIIPFEEEYILNLKKIENDTNNTIIQVTEIAQPAPAAPIHIIEGFVGISAAEADEIKQFTMSLQRVKNLRKYTKIVRTATKESLDQNADKHIHEVLVGNGVCTKNVSIDLLNLLIALVGISDSYTKLYINSMKDNTATITYDPAFIASSKANSDLFEDLLFDSVGKFNYATAVTEFKTFQETTLKMLEPMASLISSMSLLSHSEAAAKLNRSPSGRPSTGGKVNGSSIAKQILREAQKSGTRVQYLVKQNRKVVPG